MDNLDRRAYNDQIVVRETGKHSFSQQWRDALRDVGPVS